MRTCPLSEYLVFFKNDSEKISDHLKRCDVCGPRWSVLCALSKSPPKEPCAKPEVFGDLAAGRLSDDETATIMKHAFHCKSCSQALDSLWDDVSETLPNLDEVLKNADRELDEYLMGLEGRSFRYGIMEEHEEDSVEDIKTTNMELHELLEEACAIGIEIGSYSLEDLSQVSDKSTQEGLVKILRYLIEKSKKTK